VLHGEVHGPLEALVAGVHHLPRQPRQRLLDVQVMVRVIQVVVPEPCAADNKKETDQDRWRTSLAGSRGRLTRLAGRRRRERTVFAEAGRDGVPVEARERVPPRVHEPRRQLGEHLRRSFWKVRGLVTRVCS